MAAPEFVPRKPTSVVRTYASPPRRPESWRADRPGDTPGDVRRVGGPLGYQGPDQGYALKLVRAFDDRLKLDADETVLDDIDAGCVAVALRRASLFGRAPVVHDLTVAYTVFGFLDPSADPALKALRKKAFAGVSHPHHYGDLRAVADLVPDEVLRQPKDAVEKLYAAGWRNVVHAPGEPSPG